MQKNMSGSLSGVIDEMLSGSVAGNIQFESTGGSTVTITPTLESGTKIADFTIDDTDGSLYAPTPEPPIEYTAGDNINISEENVISATDTTYTAGNNITIENGVISANTSGVNYSTNEQVIGTWVDGKPIYRKTIYFPNGLLVQNNNWVSIGITASSLNIERFIKAFAMGSPELAGGSGFNINVGNVNSNVSVYCDRNGDTIFIDYLTFEYTKTTD